MSWTMVLNDHFEFRTYCYQQNAVQLGVNAFKYKIVNLGGIPNVDAQDLCNAMSTAIGPLYADVLDSNAKYQGASIQDFPARTFLSDWSKLGAANGTIAGSDLPTQTSGLISWKTIYAGAKGRGRTYLPFPSSTSSGGTGAPTAGYVTAAQALAARLIGDWIVTVTGGTCTIILQLNNAKGTGDYKTVGGYNVPAKWATQRRRGPYGRLNDIPSPLS